MDDLSKRLLVVREEGEEEEVVGVVGVTEVVFSTRCRMTVLGSSW